MSINKTAAEFAKQATCLNRFATSANQSDMFELTILQNQVDETRRAINQLANEVDYRLAELKRKSKG